MGLGLWGWAGAGSEIESECLQAMSVYFSCGAEHFGVQGSGLKDLDLGL